MSQLPTGQQRILDYAPPIVRPRNPCWIIMPAAVIHFFASVVLFFFNFSSSMSRFDTGAAPSVGEQVANITDTLLRLPLVELILWLNIPAPGLFGWVVFIANSFCWGCVVWWCVKVRRGRHRGSKIGSGAI